MHRLIPKLLNLQKIENKIFNSKKNTIVGLSLVIVPAIIVYTSLNLFKENNLVVGLIVVACLIFSISLGTFQDKYFKKKMQDSKLIAEKEFECLCQNSFEEMKVIYEYILINNQEIPKENIKISDIIQSAEKYATDYEKILTSELDIESLNSLIINEAEKRKAQLLSERKIQKYLKL